MAHGALPCAIDVALDWTNTAAAADAIAHELAANGPFEVGLDGHRRRGLKLVPTPVTAGDSCLADGDVVLVTGGARGVTAEAALALAESAKPTLILLGRSDAPTPEPDYLAGVEGEAAIKQALLDHALADSKHPTPAELQAAYHRHSANREIATNLTRIQNAGAQVSYRSVDVRDAQAVRSLCDEIRQQLGPIRGLIHAAGVIEDRLIDDKTPEQFDAVFDTKVAGLRTLLEAVESDDLKCLVLFSSVSGRFGRQGQVDYAMANEVLNKAAQRQAALRPACRVVSINWGPWESGMISPALAREFTRQGVELIPLQAGARCLVDELRSGNDAAEVIIGGTPDEPPTHTAPSAPISITLTPAFERTLDAERHPFLDSHVIGGHRVLPVAMMIEWLSHGALHSNPGLTLSGCDNLRVLKGLILADEPRTMRVLTSTAVREDDHYRVSAELRSLGDNGTELVHARAALVLCDTMPSAPRFKMPARIADKAYQGGVERAYEEVLFHGPHFHALDEIRGFSKRGIVARVKPGSAPAAWMDEPVRSGWLTDPLVIDAGLQLGLLWSHEQLGNVCLPTFTASYRQYRREYPSDGATAILKVRDHSAQKLTADVTFLDAGGDVVASLNGQEWTVDAALMAAFKCPVVVRS